MRPAAFMFAAVLLGVACSGDGPSAPAAGTGPFTISGVPARDTALAAWFSPVVVTLRDDAGAPLAGAAVEFEGLPDTFAYAATLRISPDVGMHYGRTAVATTDSSGSARGWVLLSCFAGTARLRVRAPGLGRDTTLSIVVQPGNAVRIRLLPRDTVVFIGSTYEIRGGVVDACGNTRSDPVTLATVGTAVSRTGASVRGVSVGRAAIVAAFDSMVDTAWVTPLPRGEVTGVADGCRIVTQYLDGSHASVLAQVPNYCNPHPTWLANGTVAWEQEDNAGYWSIWRAGNNLGPAVMIPATSYDFFLPEASVDGQTLYYSRGIYWGYGASQGDLWRSSATGANPVPIDPCALTCIDHTPAPAPDGQRVAFLRSGNTLMMLTLATNQVIQVGLSAASRPKWSPDGQVIAYTSGGGIKGYWPSNGATSFVSPSRIDADSLIVYGPVAWLPSGPFLVAAAYRLVWQPQGAYYRYYDVNVIIDVNAVRAWPLPVSLPGSPDIRALP